MAGTMGDVTRSPTNLPTVMHVIPGLDAGGAEGMLTRLVTAKRAQPFNQIVINFQRGGAIADTIRAAQIPVHDLGIGGPAGMPAGLLRLARLIRAFRPVALQGWLYYGDLASSLALRWSGLREQTRLYWGVRNSDMDLSRYRPLLRLAARACVRWSDRPDAVVANSYVGRDVHIRRGYRARHFPVIPNGIDTGTFRPDANLRTQIRGALGIADNAFVVIHAARVDPMKDHALLLQAAGQLPALTFLAVGEGTQNLRAPRNVIALGMRRDMPALYAASDLTLSTSAFGEGFPNVIAEAMACGVPAVATDVGDARRIVGDTGFITPPRDSAALVTAIGGLAGEPDGARQQRGGASRQRIETEFSLERAVTAFDALHLHGKLPSDIA